MNSEQSRNRQDENKDFLSSLYSTLKANPLIVGVLIILFFCFRTIVWWSETTFQDNNYFKNVVIIFGLIIICLIMIYFFNIIIKKHYEKYICKECSIIQIKNRLQFFNLVSFDKLLKIESSLANESGNEKEVYIYSMYKDNDIDNSEKVRRVYKRNSKKGVKYYDFYYGELKANQKSYMSDQNQKRLSDIYDRANEFLDCLLYNTTNFDMMIYKWNETRIEGYFCVNFPNKKRCEFAAQQKDCNNPCSKDTDTLFYKKMPDNIAIDIYDILKDIKNERK